MDTGYPSCRELVFTIRVDQVLLFSSGALKGPWSPQPTPFNHWLAGDSVANMVLRAPIREWSADARFPGAFEAVRLFAENHLNLPPVIGARLSLGIALLKPLEGYTGALTLVWKPHRGYSKM